MKKYKLLLINSLLVGSIIALPSASFAKSDSHSGHNGLALGLQVHANVKASNGNDQENNNDNNVMEVETDDNGNVSGNLGNSINLSGITAPTVLKVGEQGTWTVKASSSTNSSLSYSVDWGDNATLGMRAALAPTFTQDATFTHTYTQAGNYKVTFTVKDSSGNMQTSSVTVHVTGSVVVNAPVISGLTVKSVKKNQAKITWTTDVPSSSALWFGTTTPVNTTIAANISHSAKVFNHQITLKKLQANTTYYVVVGSSDSAGQTLSTQTSFTTKGLIDKTAPVISAVATSGITPTGGSITWTTDEKTTSQIFISTRTPVDINANGTISVIDSASVTSHSLNITGLQPSTLYHYIVKSVDASGNVSTSSEFTFTTAS